MLIDIRIPEIEEIDKYIDLPVNSISIGNEGCPYKVPSFDDIKKIADQISNKKKKLKLITPILYDNFDKPCIELVKQVCTDFGDQIEIVINDYPLLDITADLANQFNTNFTVGRLLAASFLNDPWSDLYLNEEEPFVKDWYLKSDFDQDDLILFFKNEKVSAIEENYFPEAVPSFQNIIEKGLSVKLHINLYNVSVTRSCHTARFFNKSFPECKTKCNQMITAIIEHYCPYSKILNPNENFFEPVNEQIRDIHPTYHVLGNVIQVPINRKNIKYDQYCKEVILESRYYASLDKIYLEIESINNE